MIKEIKDINTYLEICDKLEYTDCKLSKKALYGFMVAGKNVHVYTTIVEEMKGCAVISVNNDISGDLTLSVVFLWMNPHYRKLWKNYMKFIELKAIEFHCKKISFTTSRSEKSIERQMGKYGYKKVYSIIEKEIKEGDLI